ncbi:metallophosphoesterase family protein [Bacillus cereus]|uniref:metallophosphoesterase family protein n=1 Tax=Bacillus cereus TaxID=1396 RepID=UPI002ABFDDBE|nr:metallophosphoesterase [Bacillus cereus]MDZ4567251.1 metallophosphoesterase [Bacillus cereus]
MSEVGIEKKLIDEVNLSKAANILFGKLLAVSKLNLEGTSVNGQVPAAEIKLELYCNFFEIECESHYTWGNLVESVPVDNYKELEGFFNHLVQMLKDAQLLGVDVPIFGNGDTRVKFTKKGYLLYLGLTQKSECFKLDFNDGEESQGESEELQSVSLDLEDLFLRNKLLQEIYDFKTHFDKKINAQELIVRIIQEFNPSTKQYKFYSDMERSKKYTGLEDVKERIEKCLFSMFRENLIEYDYSYTGLVTITKYGVSVLTGSQEITAHVEPELKVNTIIHITDLHFGSFENTGVDNKEGIKDISDLQIQNDRMFKDAIKDELKDDTILIVGGDLTSKNEKEGFEKAKQFINGLGIRNKNMFIVPGNHDYDRTATEDAHVFAVFKHYFERFNTPFAKESYILNKDLKLFVYGFNTVHLKRHNDDIKEFVYVSEQDIQELEMKHEELLSEIEDFANYTKIAVMHHNLTPHPGVELKQYSENIKLFDIKHTLMTLGFNMVVSGHKHHPLIERHHTYYGNREGELLFISGGTLFGQINSSINSFHIIKIHREINSEEIFYIDVHLYEKDIRAFINKSVTRISYVK